MKCQPDWGVVVSREAREGELDRPDIIQSTKTCQQLFPWGRDCARRIVDRVGMLWRTGKGPVEGSQSVTHGDPVPDPGFQIQQPGRKLGHHHRLH
jgi:hypothetical protein